MTEKGAVFGVRLRGSADDWLLQIRVRGFWSDDAVTLSRDVRFGSVVTGANWGSGGRDPDEVADHLEALANLGTAMVTAATLGRRLAEDFEGREQALREFCVATGCDHVVDNAEGGPNAGR